MSSQSSVSQLDDALASAQLAEDGTPRFFVQAQPGHPEWDAVVEAELSGGVAAELRTFLDAQLEAGDLLIDVAPGFGFVSLSAATAPGGTPSVFTLVADDRSSQALFASARAAGVWVETFLVGDMVTSVLATHVANRLEAGGRAFVHSDAQGLAGVLTALTPILLAGQVVACCLTVERDASGAECAESMRLLEAYGLVPHVMRAVDGAPELFPITSFLPGMFAVAIFEIVGEDEAEDALVASHGHRTDDAVDDESVFGAVVTSDITVVNAVVRNAPATPHVPQAQKAQSRPVTASVAPPSFSFIAPYCRTGYGVVGAHLLREFGAIGAPFAFFPLGAIDPTIAPNDFIMPALTRQGVFNDRAPSVRLSQQFDLALHVGRGARIGFPIFELDRFHPAERHHLQRQDRLVVTCAWARDVLLENGIWRTPIDIVPLGVDRTVFNERVHPSEKAAGSTVFMNIGKLERRKGQRELLAAFEAAFTPKDPVKLVLICHNPFVDEATFRAMIAPFQKSPMARRITLVIKPLPTQRNLASVMATADCGVFPVRAEGWNLEALEMLSMGKHVIATACTAHTAFLDDSNARLIEASTLEESVRGESRGRWAAWGPSQHEQLIDHLRTVHQQRQGDALPVNQPGIDTAERFSWRASADALVNSVVSAS